MHRSALAGAGVDLVATVDPDQAKAADAAAQVVGCRPYTDVSQMLRDVNPDVVHVVTPPKTHSPLAIQVMDASAHVVIEKPMALSVAEADEMIAAAAKSQVHCICVHNCLWKPSVLKARRLLEQGRLGEVVFVDAYFGFSQDEKRYGITHWSLELPGGCFTNYFPHLIYLQEAFLGGIRAVSGVTAGRHRDGSLAEVSVLVEGASGPGVMTVSTRTGPYAKYIQIHGTEGIVHADLVTEVTTFHSVRRAPRLVSKVLFNAETVAQLTAGTVANSARVAARKLPDMPDLHNFVVDLYGALKQGLGAPPGATAEDGRRVARVLEAIWADLPEATSAPAGTTVAAPAPPRTSTERRVCRDGITGTVLVTGAGGFLGRYLVAALHRCGADVRALVRNPAGIPGALPSQATIVVGNTSNENIMRSAMEGVEVVVHCAAVVTNNVAWRLHQESNITGTQLVLQIARESGVRRLVHISSLSVYGIAPGTTEDGAVTEDTPLASDIDRWAYYLRSKVSAENVLQDDCNAVPEKVILRPGIIYGPGASGPITKRLVQFGRTRMIVGHGNNRLPLSFVDNVVDGILLAIMHPQAGGRIYNLVDDPHPTVREAALRAAGVTGERLRLVGMPEAVLMPIASWLENRAAAAGADKPPLLSCFQIAQATRDVRYSSRRAREELRWAPEVELDEGLTRTFAPEMPRE